MHGGGESGERAARRARMRRRLRALYGDEGGDRAFGDLKRLLARVGPAVGATRRARGGPAPDAGSGAVLPFDEADAVLITYGDTFLYERPPEHGPATPPDPDRAPLRALADVAERRLAGLVSTIHVLPFFPYSSDYGFSVVDYERVDAALGTWGDVARLAARFKLMVDFVLNHISAESAWFRAFLRAEPPYDRYFIVADPDADLRGVTRPRTTPLLTPVETAAGRRHVWTTFSADQVDLNYAEPAVLLRMIEVLLGYVERGADLIRMDAVGYLWKRLGTSCIHLPETHEVVKLFRDVLDDVAPGVAIVTETNVPHRDNVAYFGDGSDEAHMVYQFPLAPLVLHALAIGDATRLAGWAATLEAPSAGTTFFNFLASHDGIGVVPATGILTPDEVAMLAERVRAHGGEVSYKTNPDGSESPYELNATWFDALSDPRDAGEPFATKLDRFICSQAIMLALPGVPGIYVHSLFGSRNDRAGYARSGWKRDLNHERLVLGELEGRLDDPASETARVFARYGALLRARRAQPAFHPNAPGRPLALDPRVLAVLRGPRGGQSILALHNVSAEPVALDLAGAARPGDEGAALADVLGGPAATPGAPFSLPPYGVAWLAATHDR
jgi:glucosylglycerate phosphorylase